MENVIILAFILCPQGVQEKRKAVLDRFYSSFDAQVKIPC